MALGGALVSVLVAGDAAAGVGLASTFVLRGRRGTWRQALAFCVAGVTWRSLFVTQLLDTPRPPLSPAARLSHTQHNFVTHHLSHTTLSTTIFHTPSFTHNFHTQLFHHTHTHHLSLSHTNFHMQLCHHNLRHLLCLSFLPRPRYNIWCS